MQNNKCNKMNHAQKFHFNLNLSLVGEREEFDNIQKRKRNWNVHWNVC